jgi:hypothetical protein
MSEPQNWKDKTGKSLKEIEEQMLNGTRQPGKLHE